MVWELERDVAPDMPWTNPITIPEFEVYKKKIFSHPKFNPDSWFFILNGNKIVGMNNLWESEINKGIETGLTGVSREYRRKGVATALKHTGLTWAKNNGYESIRTDNVATNEGMLNINIQAGFKFIPAWLVFDKTLAKES
jgi:RimJ/RimL family protein N-acetyltransferase